MIILLHEYQYAWFFVFMTWSNLFFALANLVIFSLVTYLLWKIFLQDIYYMYCRMRRGVVVDAEIVYLLDSLLKVQYRALYHIQFRFYIGQQQVLSNRVKVLLTKTQVQHYAVGTIVKIKYDAKNLDNLVIITK